MLVRGLQSEQEILKTYTELKHWQEHSTVPQGASLPARQSRSQETVSEQPAG